MSEQVLRYEVVKRDSEEFLASFPASQRQIAISFADKLAQQENARFAVIETKIIHDTKNDGD